MFSVVNLSNRAIARLRLLDGGLRHITQYNRT